MVRYRGMCFLAVTFISHTLSFIILYSLSLNFINCFQEMEIQPIHNTIPVLAFAKFLIIFFFFNIIYLTFQNAFFCAIPYLLILEYSIYIIKSFQKTVWFIFGVIAGDCSTPKLTSSVAQNLIYFGSVVQSNGRTHWEVLWYTWLDLRLSTSSQYLYRMTKIWIFKSLVLPVSL